MEIPEVRDYKEQDPEEKECCFGFYKRLETGRQATGIWQKGTKQEEHAKQPPDRLPGVSPSQFPVVRRASPGADNQTNN